MMYLLDLFFILGYLAIKEVFTRMIENDVNQFLSLRKIAVWVEYTYILLFMCILPVHSASESCVRFVMCATTKIVFDLICTELKKKK